MVSPRIVKGFRGFKEFRCLGRFKQQTLNLRCEGLGFRVLGLRLGEFQGCGLSLKLALKRLRISETWGCHCWGLSSCFSLGLRPFRVMQMGPS